MFSIKEIYKNNHNEFGIVIKTNFCDEEPLNSNIINIMFFKWSIYIQIPQILKPLPIQEYNNYSKSYYTTYLGREYGIYTFEDVVFLKYGIYNDNWCRDSKYNSRMLILNMNWKQYTFVRNTIYDKNFSVLWQKHDLDKSLNVNSDIDSWDFIENMSDDNKFKFKFSDFDDEEITAICHIEERVWYKGRKEFSWLKYFTKPLIRLSLAIKYSSEVGHKKGSWKGGVIGTGIDFDINENIADVFKRHCDNNNLTFIEQLV